MLPDLPLSRVKILVVDDDAVVRGLYTIVLREAGASVMASATASEGIDFAAVNCPDVVITDLRMPGRDGGWLLRELRACTPTLPVIVITGDANAPDDICLSRLGFTVILRKPVVLSVLTSTVERLIRPSDIVR